MKIKDIFTREEKPQLSLENDQEWHDSKEEKLQLQWAECEERYGLLKLPSMVSMTRIQVMQQKVAGNKAQVGSDQSS